MTRKQAESELRHRLRKVERKGWRKPPPLTFATYAERWSSSKRRICSRAWILLRELVEAELRPKEVFLR